MASDGSQYDQAWDRFRELERSFHRTSIASFALFGCGALLLNAAERVDPDPGAVKVFLGVPFMLASLAAVALMVRSAWRLARCPCPRCGNAFLRLQEVAQLAGA